MYIPEHFAQTDRRVQVEFARQYNFGILLSVTEDQPQATHVPFLIDVLNHEVADSGRWKIRLRGHVARANPHWRHLQDKNCLAIFQGPHTYISPTWYQSPGVPTWNYTAVHMQGRAELVEDGDDLRDIVDELSALHESVNPTPWQGNYSPGMLNAIVGFTVAVVGIEAKFKLSQNRSDADKTGVLEALMAPFGKTPDDNHRQTRTMMQNAFRK